MNASATTDLKVNIADDKQSAVLTVPAGYPADVLDVDTCTVSLQAHGVQVTRDVIDACASLVARVKADGTDADLTATVARATPPQDGKDGRIQWLVDHRPVEAASHYDRCAFTMVREGDEVARIIEPEPHQDGTDVTGAIIRAKPGKPVALKTDESLLRDARGMLIAQVAGALDRTTNVVRIRNVLDVPEYVDFSTGNIDFAGDVIINKGVRDRFLVRTTGSIQCLGVIEGAIIECGGDLTTRGMAGHDRGTASVGRNLHARYLDNVVATVGQNLCIEKSLVNCDTTVHGAMVCPNATVIGGRHVVTGVVQVHTLGSPANVATTLVLGTVPRLDPAYNQLLDLVSQLSERHHNLSVEYERLRAVRNPAAAQRERITELHYDIARCADSLHKGKDSLGRLHERITQLRTIRLVVSHVLHIGCILQIGGENFRIREDIKGPLAIELDGHNQPSLVAGDAHRIPLTAVADPKGNP